jgi:hypothetical protein
MVIVKLQIYLMSYDSMGNKALSSTQLGALRLLSVFWVVVFPVSTSGDALGFAIQQPI